MAYYLTFAAYDNPMHLSKVGNWVMTFLSEQHAAQVQLAISSVIPRQHHSEIQARRWIIQETTSPHCWQVLSLECYDPSTQRDGLIDLEQPQAQHCFQQFIAEFEKYDVSIQLKHGTSSVIS